jgi:hypothetical protein
MARSKLPWNVWPGPSNGAADEMAAAMNWPAAATQKAPLRFDACCQWYQGLTTDQQEWVTYVVDAFTSWGEEAGQRYPARLLVAPKRPL